MNDKIDTLTFDIPLIIRMLELSREELKGDQIIHVITQKLLELSKHNNVLTMEIYPEIERLLPRKEKKVLESINRLKTLSGIL